MDVKKCLKLSVILVLSLFIFTACDKNTTSSVGADFYRISFNSDGGSRLSSQAIPVGGTITRPSDPTKEGYEFVGWTLNGEIYDFTKGVTSSFELVANWKEKEIPTYNILFDSDGGNIVASQSVKENEKIVKPEDPKKSGYTFKGWTYLDNLYDFETPVTNEMVLKASWEKNTPKPTQPIIKYTVTFNSAGGTPIASQSIQEWGNVTRPKDPVRDGYKFIEWQCDNKKWNFNAPVKNDMILTAVWEKIPVITYTLTFETNGGSTIAPIQVLEGTTPTRPSDPIRSGRTFVEWQYNGKKYNFDTPINKDMTLYATWKLDTSVRYIITFNSNGGSQVLSRVITADERVLKPTDPVREGYRFVEWRLNGKAFDFNTEITSDITLVAYWIKEINVPIIN